MDEAFANIRIRNGTRAEMKTWLMERFQAPQPQPLLSPETDDWTSGNWEWDDDQTCWWWKDPASGEWYYEDREGKYHNENDGFWDPGPIAYQ